MGSLDAPRLAVADTSPDASDPDASDPDVSTAAGATATLAGTTGASDSDAQATGTGPGLLIWVVCGAVLIGAGWWLQSRRRL